MIKRLVNFVSYIAVMAAVSVLGLELIVRLIGLAPPLPDQNIVFTEDQFLPWRGKPNVVRKGRSNSDEFDFEHRFNKLGFRDRDHDVEKPPGVFRILALGDSFTMGAGAPFEDTFLQQLKKHLEQDGQLSGKRFELINFGISRYWPEPERVSLEYYGVHFDPDLVLVTFIPNDIADTKIRSRMKVSDGYLVSLRSETAKDWEKLLFKASHIARLIFPQVWDSRLEVKYSGRFAKQEEISDDEAWLNIEKEYSQIAKITKSMDVPFVLMSIPDKPPWNDKYKAISLRLSQFCERKSCHYLDTFEALADHPHPKTLFWPKDGHCTPAGYQVIGETLFEFLKSNNLVVPGPSGVTVNK